MTNLQILTFGCRLNSYETEVMKNHAQSAGLDEAVILNSCAVTSEAVRQLRQKIRKLHREEPDRKIIVTGCAAQTEQDYFLAMPEVDHVIGNDDKMKPDVFSKIAGGSNQKNLVSDIMSATTLPHNRVTGLAGRARAHVQIQNGCDHRCTFCIIPFGRGPSRSVPVQDIISEIKALVDNGYKEVVFTGVDITAYGEDLEGNDSLGTLVQHCLSQVTELERLRISSIDALETDPALLETMASEQRLMPHLHLSLQAGDNMILKRMKRRHLREDAIAFCADLRQKRPDISFGADLIAGFPTETEEMFQNTLKLVDECGLSLLHIFPFSPRPGTPAARMPQLNGKVISQRAALLREKGNWVLAQHLEGYKNKTVEILTEKDNIGRTADFTQVRLDKEVSTGRIVQAKISGHNNKMLIGNVT